MRSPFAASHAEHELKLRHYEALSVPAAELRRLSHAKLLALGAELEQLILTLNTELVAELAKVSRRHSPRRIIAASARLFRIREERARKGGARAASRRSPAAASQQSAAISSETSSSTRRSSRTSSSRCS